MNSIALISSYAHSLSNFRGRLIRDLVNAGVTVYALAPDYTPESRAAVVRLGANPIDISLDRTGMNPLRDLLDTCKLVGTLRRLRVEATFAYFLKPVLYGSLAAWAARVPLRYALVAGLGYTLIGNNQATRSRGSLMSRAILFGYRLAFRACRVVFFQNSDDLELLSRACGLESVKALSLGGSGVDLDYFEMTPLPREPIVFVMLGRLLREKGVFEYARAAAALKPRFPSVRFLLVGGFDLNPGGVSEAEIESIVREGAVEWVDHVEDVRPWIAKASVFVLPSYREGMPRSTQEALAMGRPVITTDTAGCRDTVVDGRNGILIPVADADALRAAMQHFIDNPGLIPPMGEASRRLAEERFDVRTINRRILEAIGLGTGASDSTREAACGR